MWRTAGISGPRGGRRHLDGSSTGRRPPGSNSAGALAEVVRERRPRAAGPPRALVPKGVRLRPRPGAPLVASLVALAEVVQALGVDVLAPAGPVASRLRGVESQSSDHHEGVAGVRVDGDPVSLAAASPAHEAARVEGAAKQPAAVKRVADGAGAVVAVVSPAAVAAAVHVRLVADV